MIAGEECPSHRANVTTDSPASSMIEAYVCRSTWKPGYCHRVMLDAVRYVVDNGVKWVNLPCDFPPYRRGTRSPAAGR